MHTPNLGPLPDAHISVIASLKRPLHAVAKERALDRDTASVALPVFWEQGDDDDAVLIQRQPRRVLPSSASNLSLLVGSALVEDLPDRSGTAHATGTVCDAVALFSADTRPSLTIQPLPALRPSPPRLLRQMLDHSGGGRSRPVDIGRPGPERLAVLHVGGCDNGETEIPQSPHSPTSRLQPAAMARLDGSGEADTVDNLRLYLLSERLPDTHSFSVGFTPEHLGRFERRVAKRIREGHLDQLRPLKRAVHNCLARVVDIKAGTKEREHAGVTRSKRSRNHSRTSSFKLNLEQDQQPRRARPLIQPLDIKAACAHVPTTDSPPDSPVPTTPVDDCPVDSVHVFQEEGQPSQGFVQHHFVQRKH